MGWVHRIGVRRTTALSGLALSTCLLGSAVAALPAQALAPAAVSAADAGSGKAVISGTLVVPGPDRAPSGVPVTLTGIPTSGDPITRTVTSRDGAFTFRDLAGGDWSYTVTAPYQGTTFSSDRISVPAGQGVTLKLPLFASTESADKVTTSSWIVWLDVTGDKLAVQQDVAYTNAGTAAYTGKTPVEGAGTGAKAAVLLPTAAGAGTFQYLGRFEVCCSATQPDAWVHTRPINPGGSSGTLRYEAPIATSLTFTAQFPTDKMSLLVPQGTVISSPQLTADGTTTDRNITYNVFRSGALKAGATVTVTLGETASTSGSSTPWALIAGIGAAVIVVAVVVWLILRRRKAVAGPAPVGAPKGATVKSAPAAKPAKKPPVTAPAATSQAAAPPVHPRTPAEQLAEQLAALDLKFENGELTDEAAYRRVRESLVQQLVDAVAVDPTSLS